MTVLAHLGKFGTLGPNLMLYSSCSLQNVAIGLLLTATRGSPGRLMTVTGRIWYHRYAHSAIDKVSLFAGSLITDNNRPVVLVMVADVTIGDRPASLKARRIKVFPSEV